MSDGLDGIREAQRRTWAAGNYVEVGKDLLPASEAVVARAQIAPGMDVLDVATGSGNAALLAARAGGVVTGIDFTPALLDAARERAREEGLDITLREGDAEALDLPDAAFDRVLSVFGVMFAPNHARAAAELWRVCRPGGRIVITAWTPAGGIGDILSILQEGAPPPPPGFQPPPLWGSPRHLRELFPEGELSTSVEELPFHEPSVDAWLESMETHAGPVVVAKARLEAEGRWQEMRERLRHLTQMANEADDGSLLLVGEYLLAVVHKPGPGA